MSRQSAERGGRRGETIAAVWLMLKGWSIVGRRLRTNVGEVDLVARRGRILIFVEVKARTKPADAELSLDHYRLRRVAAAAQALAPRLMRPGDDVRIDAIFIVPRRLPRPVINVWQG
ncbi:MAG TPA: YraN family protein [Allosphingosinicella sp.]|nr:YraN family protein [Allosphingosinicella sp.]